MSKILLAVSLVAFVAGCAPKTETIVVAPEPISSEPASTGKYK